MKLLTKTLQITASNSTNFMTISWERRIESWKVLFYYLFFFLDFCDLMLLLKLGKAYLSQLRYLNPV